MTRPARGDWRILIGGLLLALCVVAWQLRAAVQCRHRGGLPVRGFWNNIVCVERPR